MLRWVPVLLALSSVALAQRGPLVVVETGFEERFEIRGPVSRRALRRAFPEYRVVHQRREAEAGGHYETYCFSRWGRDRGCKLEWDLDGDLVRNIKIFDSRVRTGDGLAIGERYRDHEAAFGECHVDGFLMALVCELRALPEGYAFFNLEPNEVHEPPTAAQLDAAEIRWLEVRFGSERDDQE